MCSVSLSYDGARGWCRQVAAETIDMCCHACSLALALRVQPAAAPSVVSPAATSLPESLGEGPLLAIYGVSVKREGSLETPGAGTAIVRVLRLLAVSATHSLP